MLFIKIILNNKHRNIQLLGRNNKNYISIATEKINMLNEVIEDILLHQEQFTQEEKQFRENWLKYNGCELYLAGSKRKHFTVTSLWRKFCDINYYDVTMAIQMSVDRIELLGLHDKQTLGWSHVSDVVRPSTSDDAAQTLRNVNDVTASQKQCWHTHCSQYRGKKIYSPIQNVGKNIY